MTADTVRTAREAVQNYIAAMERRDLQAAGRLLAPGAVLIFPGDRRLGSPADVAINSAGRYRRVAKVIDAIDVTEDGARIIVMCRGTLRGEWIDGGAFSGVRFLDRFDIQNGKIVRQEVWNDAAEARLARIAGTSSPARPAEAGSRA